MTQKKGYWQELCEQAAREMDSTKLLELTERLIKALEEEAFQKAAAKGRIATPQASRTQ